MADGVQATLDTMVPALRDLLSKGIFSETEIRSIVKRRRQYEYLLRRRQARKADYFRYIDDEVKLERLRSLRNRKLLARKAFEESEHRKGRTVESRAKEAGSSNGDASIVQHIHFIYSRAIRKWRDDVSLHLEHARFAKKAKSFKQLSRIYTEALQVHPRNITLWIEAASYEYFGSSEGDGGRPDSAAAGSVANARVLLQRGLRVNPRSKDIWLQYFALEFHYIQKLRGRREILKLGLNKKSPAETAAGGDDVESSATIPFVVYNNAIKSIGDDDIEFRLRFVDLCHMFPETEAIKAHIMATVKRDFADKPEGWIARAEYVAENRTIRGQDSVGFLSRTDNSDEVSVNGLTATHHILNEATDSIKSVTMYLKAIHFVKHLLDIDAEHASHHAIFLGRLFEKAEDARVSSPALVLEYAEYHVYTGNADKSATLLREAIDNDKECSKCAKIWIMYANLIHRVGVSATSTSDLTKDALRSFAIHEHGYMEVIIFLFKQMVTLPTDKLEGHKRKTQQADIAELFERILLLSSSSQDVDANIPQLCFLYLQSACAIGGLDAARKVYESAIFSSSYAKSHEGKSEEDLGAMRLFYDACIKLEQSGAAIEGADKKRLRRLYDSASNFFRLCNKNSIASEYRGRRNMENLL